LSREIERKFLLAAPLETVLQREDVTLVARDYMYQTYLAYAGDQEMRIRKIVDQSGRARFTHTFKAGHGLAREEIEYAISETMYEQLLRRLNAVPLEKIRTTVEHRGHRFEIDEYKQVQLTVVEVEFPDEAAAGAFAPPAWFGRELGAEEEFRNKTLWLKLQTGAPAAE
jgi:adenylate cyclase